MFVYLLCKRINRDILSAACFSMFPLYHVRKIREGPFDIESGMVAVIFLIFETRNKIFFSFNS